MGYYIEYSRAKRMVLGRADAMTPAQARDRAKQLLGEAYAGGDPMASRRAARAHTFVSFIDDAYAPWAEANIRTAKATVARLKGNFPDLQHKKLKDVTPWLVEKWRAARLKGGAKPTTVNRDLDDLKSSLAKAVHWGFLDAHPLATVKRSRVDTSPTPRFLGDDEQLRLEQAFEARDERIRQQRDNANAWRRERGYPELPSLQDAAFADHLKPMVLLSLHTGLRQGELFKLAWADVDLTRANLTIHGAHAKTRQTRHIPLNDEALEVLRLWKSQAPEPHDLVFPGKNGRPLNNVRKAWQAVLSAAGIEKFRWHDMRHTFASRLVMHGVDLNTVRELLGHSDYKMTLRYAHLAPEHKAAAVARLVGARP